MTATLIPSFQPTSAAELIPLTHKEKMIRMGVIFQPMLWKHIAKQIGVQRDIFNRTYNLERDDLPDNDPSGQSLFDGFDRIDHFARTSFTNRTATSA